jgi:hypothetical protein
MGPPVFVRPEHRRLGTPARVVAFRQVREQIADRFEENVRGFEGSAVPVEGVAIVLEPSGGLLDGRVIPFEGNRVSFEGNRISLEARANPFDRFSVFFESDVRGIVHRPRFQACGGRDYLTLRLSRDLGRPGSCGGGIGSM